MQEPGWVSGMVDEITLTGAAMAERVAFTVYVDDTSCITFAFTVKAARWNAVASAREAGYYSRREWPRLLTVKRTPMYDNSPLRDRGVRKCWNPDYMRYYP